MTQTVHKVRISPLIGLNFTHGSFFTVTICTWALQAAANGDTLACHVHDGCTSYLLVTSYSIIVLLLIKFSWSRTVTGPKRRSYSLLRTKSISDPRNAFSFLFIFNLIACINFSKDTYLFEPSFPGVKL